MCEVSPWSAESELYLELANNELEDLSPFSSAAALRSLNVTNNRVRDISFLASVSLSSLWLADNPIEDFSPLGSLRNMNSLDVSRTGMVDLSPLADIERIGEFWADYNAIWDLTPLLGVELGWFSLEGNLIVDVPQGIDFGDLYENCGRPRMLDENPLSEAALEVIYSECDLGATLSWGTGWCGECRTVP